MSHHQRESVVTPLSNPGVVPSRGGFGTYYLFKESWMKMILEQVEVGTWKAFWQEHRNPAVLELTGIGFCPDGALYDLLDKTMITGAEPLHQR